MRSGTRQRRPSGAWPSLARFGPPSASAYIRALEWRSVTSAPGDRLESWKEIAAYVKRGVRTVRRWEADEGLPVHRHVHRTAGSVFAFKSEIDRWRATQTRRAVPTRVGADAMSI